MTFGTSIYHPFSPVFGSPDIAIVGGVIFSDIIDALTYAYLMFPLSVSLFTVYQPVLFVSTLYVIPFPFFSSATTFPLYISCVVFIFPSVMVTDTVMFGSL